MDCRLPAKIFTNFSEILCDAVLMKQHLITNIEYKHLTEVEGHGPKPLSGGLKRLL